MPNVSKEELNNEHMLVLYAVNKAPNGIPTKTHYQKMMYLILKSLGNDPKTSAGYTPNHYGPYSHVVEDWKSVLIDAGYLIKNTEERVRIAPDVQNEVNKIKFPDKTKQVKIDNIVTFVCSLNYKELLLYIYSDDIQKCEGMLENSDVKDEIFGDRIDIALRMTKSGKVSIAKGAELADVDVLSFMNLLNGKVSI